MLPASAKEYPLEKLYAKVPGHRDRRRKKNISKSLSSLCLPAYHVAAVAAVFVVVSFFLLPLVLCVMNSCSHARSRLHSHISQIVRERKQKYIP